MNIYQIAEKSGVSIATVSRVINGSAPVGKKTKERVLKVIEETGFTPNSFARGLNFNSMRLIGILCADFSDPFYSEAISLFEKLLREKGFNVLLVCTGYTIEGKKQGLTELVRKNVDAILLIGTVFKETDNSHIIDIARKTPVFMVNSTLEAENVYSIRCDEEEATKVAISTLIKAGYRRPLYMRLNPLYGNADKEKGYLRALKEADIEPDERLIVQVGNSANSVMRTLSELLDEDPAAFDSVLTANDVLAAYVIKTFGKLKLRMPIIGFNNSSLAELVTPELSSVDNMLGDMCKTTVDRLTDVLDSKNPPHSTLLSGTLIRRETF